jgi:hypothetical protein
VDLDVDLDLDLDLDLDRDRDRDREQEQERARDRDRDRDRVRPIAGAREPGQVCRGGRTGMPETAMEWSCGERRSPPKGACLPKMGVSPGGLHQGDKAAGAERHRGGFRRYRSGRFCGFGSSFAQVG